MRSTRTLSEYNVAESGAVGIATVRRVDDASWTHAPLLSAAAAAAAGPAIVCAGADAR